MRSGAKLLFFISLAAALAGCSSDKPTTDSGTSTTVGSNVPPRSGENSSSAPGSSNSSTPGSTPASNPGANSSGEKPLVFFSQANSADPWRQVFDRDTKSAADRQVNLFNFETSTAGDDPSKQIDQIETALVKKPKVLLVSPATVAVQKAIEDAHYAGVFVVLLDRSVPGNKWDCYVGGDNRAIGNMAGAYMGKKLNGKGTVLMIQGIADAPPTKDRAQGFMDAIHRFPGIKVIMGNNCDYQRVKAESYMENFLQSGKPFDAVYAHNDEMAIGAYKAMEAAHTPKKVIVGIDGCQMEIVNMVKAGQIDASFSYPDPGPKGIEIAAQAINGQKPKSTKVLLASEPITKETADAYVAAHPNLAK